MPKQTRFSGRNLKAARLKMGIGRLLLARHIDFLVTPKTIKRYEDGRTTPDYNVASALAVALGVKLDALTETTDAKS